MIDLDAVLGWNSARFIEVLGGLPEDVPVPSCPDWSAGDLLWHLTSVQAHWADIVERRLPPGDSSGAGPRPERPSTHADLVALFDSSSQRLRAALAVAVDEEPVWTWSADHTIGWVRRRQAHEALVHRVDAELAAGLPSEVDPVVAADGIDELLRHFAANPPDWGSFEPSGPLVAVQSSDVTRSWVVQVGRFRGVEPEGDEVDEPDYLAAPDGAGSPDVTIAGAAVDLLLWLWGRGDGADLRATGQQAAMPALREAIVANT